MLSGVCDAVTVIGAYRPNYSRFFSGIVTPNWTEEGKCYIVTNYRS